MEDFSISIKKLKGKYLPEKAFYSVRRQKLIFPIEQNRF